MQDQRWKAPERIGQYRILDRMAAGGGADDYRAVHATLGKPVIIRAAVGATSLTRLRHVAQLHAQLVHPGVHDVYDVFEDKGAVCTVLKFLEGERLSERVEKGPVPLIQALEYARQIADALAYMHKSGVVNGGIKPKNIFVERGRVYVSKFNAARRMAGDESLAPEAVIATSGYAPAEQLQGFRFLRPQSDIYSLGVTLYELLAGRMPSAQTDLSFPDGFPHQPRDLLRAMLAHAPEARPASAAEVRAYLDDLMRGTSACIAMPFAESFKPVREAIQAACRRAGVECQSGVRDLATGDIVASARAVDSAGFLIVDLSPGQADQTQPFADPDVLYQLGLACGQEKDVIAITQDARTLTSSFGSQDAMVYERSGLESLEQALEAAIRSILERRKRLMVQTTTCAP